MITQKVCFDSDAPRCFKGPDFANERDASTRMDLILHKERLL